MSCHELPRAARSKQELQRTAQRKHELPKGTWAASNKQELPGAAKNY